MDIYSKYDADTLEEFTHLKSPWRNARGNLLPYEAFNNRVLDKYIYLTFCE